jgi:mRNA interferase MazF
MERGEVWWADEGARWPFVLLSVTTSRLQAVQVVPPATAEQKRGFLVLSGSEALDGQLRQQIVASADASTSAIGIEVALGVEDGLAHDGVVRVALPREGRTFCTWIVTLTRADLIVRIGMLSPARLRELDNALRLAAVV